MVYGNSLFDAALARKKPMMPAAGDTSGQVPALASAPQAAGGAGAAAFGGGINPPAIGGGISRWASWAPTAPPPVSGAIAGAHIPQLSANPQLPQHPLGAYTDSQYEADNAVLGQTTNANYQNILSQTGYNNEEGQHIAGDVELAAARQERDQLTGLNNAVNDQVGNMQQAGTIFSGYNALTRGQAEQPFITALGDLAVETPRSLTHLYQQAEDLMREYTLSQNQLLEAAATRRANALASAPPAAAGTPQAGAAATAQPLQTNIAPTDTNIGGVVAPSPLAPPVVPPRYLGKKAWWL